MKFLRTAFSFFIGVKLVALSVLLPLRLVWVAMARPIVVLLYKLTVVIRQRFKTYFHAQHKLLAVLTHRFALHTVVMLLTIGIVTLNLAHAQEVRAEEFAEGSLVSKLFHSEEETVITAATARPTRYRYIDASASLTAMPGQGISQDPDSDENFLLAASGGAVDGAQGISPTTDATRDEITRYTVQSGDTASTIAEQFDITTRTVLETNGLSDASLIRPGDSLYILPTSGVAHTVESGETILSIAKEFDADPNEILEYNELLDATDLQAGVEIIIPGGRKPLPPVSAAPVTRLASIRDVFSSTPSPSAAPAGGGSMNWPTSCRRISQYYGYRHTGIDIDCEFGNAIYAADGGTVVAANWYGGYGLQVLINHGNGMQTRYGHMQKVFVTTGQSISKGQTLGEMGSTGRSTGSHLHFEVIVGGRTVNPFSYY